MGIQKIARNGGLMWGYTIEWDFDFPFGEPVSIPFRRYGHQRFLGTAQITVILHDFAASDTKHMVSPT